MNAKGYDRARAAALADYHRAIDAAEDEFERVRAAALIFRSVALAKIDSARTDCERARAAALAEFERVTGAARTKIWAKAPEEEKSHECDPIRRSRQGRA